MLPAIKAQLDPIFRPRSVAIVGASNNPDRWGYETTYNVLNWSQFRGEVYPIHPKDELVHGLKAFKSQIHVFTYAFTNNLVYVYQLVRNWLHGFLHGTRWAETFYKLR